MDTSARRWFLIACLLAATAIALGAFGSHALRARLEPRMLEVFEIGVRYQLIHALALLGISLGWPRLQPRRATAACALMLGGTIVFSGSLYLMVLTGIRMLGAITPIGGVALIISWVILAFSPIKK